MHAFSPTGVSCQERERLVDTLSEARSRGRNLSRLRRLTTSEQGFLDRREQAAEAQLKTHDLQHRCQS
jgi:hypothetical protein